MSKFAYAPVLALSLLALQACGNGEAKLTDEEPEIPAIPVEVAQVRQGSVTAFYSTTATLEAEREARVVPRLGGTIIELFVEEGDRVVAGQPLARIDDDRYRLSLAQAEANVRRLEQDFRRSQEMQARDLISAEAFERAKFEYEAQRAQFDIAKLELSHTTITSPIDGIVSERMIKVGNTVNTAEPAFVVTAMDTLLATLHVPERELSRLAVDQPAHIAVDALAGRRFEGHIQRISPVVDPTTGTFRATVEVTSDGALKPGMFGRVNIVYDVRDNTLLVPVEAVLAEDARTSLFVVVDGEAQRRDVEVGYRNNGSVEIRAGVTEGESVVVTGQASLRDKTKVAVIE
ncbi:MAG: efflux RND transporter periplasmic adaptor subunit [Gammaproteobacteria bacterium]